MQMSVTDSFSLYSGSLHIYEPLYSTNVPVSPDAQLSRSRKKKYIITFRKIHWWPHISPQQSVFAGQTVHVNRSPAPLPVALNADLTKRILCLRIFLMARRTSPHKVQAHYSPGNHSSPTNTNSNTQSSAGPQHCGTGQRWRFGDHWLISRVHKEPSHITQVMNDQII